MPRTESIDAVHAEAPGTAVFVGASAGGMEALSVLLAGLPGELDAPVLVVLHVGRAGTSVLPAILDRVGRLHAVTPADGEALINGRVYVAPRDHHLLVADGRLRLDRGPTEHGLRPAIDPLFRSAAREYGPRAIGVVLSGMLDDGTAGLAQIRAHGGWTVVQEPQEAAFPSMPASALEHVDVDFVLPVAEIAERLPELIRATPRDDRVPPKHQLQEDPDDSEPPGMPTDITCPHCGGVLWEEVSDRLTLYRCRAGHGFSADTLLSVQDEGFDAAIWKPIRMLHERGALLRRLAERADQQGRTRSSAYFKAQASEAFRQADEMHRSLENAPPHGSDGRPTEPMSSAVTVDRS